MHLDHWCQTWYLPVWLIKHCLGDQQLDSDYILLIVCSLEKIRKQGNGCQSKLVQNYRKCKFVNLTVAWLAQLGDCWSTEQEVAGLNPGQTNTQGLKITEKFCLGNDICKRLDFLVFLDKDEKPQVLSHSTYTYLVLVGCKRTHTTVWKE